MSDVESEDSTPPEEAMRSKKERVTFWVNRRSIKEWTSYYESGPGFKAAVVEVVAILREGKHYQIACQAVGWELARLREALAAEGHSLEALQEEGKRYIYGHLQSRRQHQKHGGLPPDVIDGGARGQHQDGRSGDVVSDGSVPSRLRDVREGDRGLLGQDRRAPRAQAAEGARGEVAPGDIFRSPQGYDFRVMALTSQGVVCQARKGVVGRFSREMVTLHTSHIKHMRKVPLK